MQAHKNTIAAALIAGGLTLLIYILIKYTPFLAGVIEDAMTLSFTLLIVFGFVWSCALLVSSSWRFQQDIARGITDPESLNHPENTLYPAARQYAASFVRLPDEVGATSLKSPVSARQYFTLVALFDYERLRFWHTVPGIFVGLGVLGTFVGLTVGLSEISSEMFNSPDVLEHKLSGLIGGMKTAFVTSVVGMSASVLFSLIQRQVFGSLEAKLKHLNNALDQRYRLSRTEDYQRLYTYQHKEQTHYPRDFMAHVIALLSDSYQVQLLSRLENKDAQVEQIKVLQTLSANVGSTISAELSGIGDKISAAFSARFTELNNTIERLNASMREMPTLMEQMHTQFQAEIESQRAGIQATFEGINAQLSHEVGQVTEALRVQALAIQQQLTDTAHTVAGQLTETSQTVAEQLTNTSQTVAGQLSALTRESTERLQEVANTLIQNMSSTVAQLSQTLDSMTSGAERMTLLLDDTREMLERQEAAVEEITAAIGEMDTSFSALAELSGSMREFSGQITRGTTAMVDSSENLRSMVNHFVTEYARLSQMQGQYHNEITGALQQTREMVAQATEQYGVIQTGLRDIFSEVENGLTRYTTESRNGLNAHLQGFASQFGEAAEALERNFNSLSSLSESMQDAVGRIDGSWQQGLQQLEQLSGRIARASEGLPDSLAQFQRTVAELQNAAPGPR